MKEIIKKLPKAVCILVCLVIVLGFEGVLNGIASMVARKLNAGNVAPYMNQMIAEILVAVYGIAAMLVVGFGKELKSKGVGWAKSLYIGGFMIGYIGCMLASQMYVIASNQKCQLQPIRSILIFLAAVFLVGVAEESVFRGAILNILLVRMGETKKGVATAIAIDAILFGGIHFINYFAGVKLSSVLVQVVTASILGALFAAIYARTGNIWHIMIIHSLVDFGALFPSAIFGKGDLVSGINKIGALSLLAVPVLLIPTITLLWKDKKEEIGERIGAVIPGQNVEERKKKQADEAAVCSLVVGICGIVFGFMGYGIGLNIVGILAAAFAKNNQTSMEKMAFAGKIISIIGLVISILMIFAIFSVLRLGVVSI